MAPKASMFHLAETTTREMETYKALIATYEKERAEWKTLTADRSL